MIFGQRLRSLREQRKITQKDLSRVLNVSESAIGMYERGEREPNFETVDKIANFFNVTSDYLLGRSNDPTPKISKKESGQLFEDYSPFLRAIKEKYPGVNLDDPDVQRKLMKAVDLVLEDYLEKQKRKQ